MGNEEGIAYTKIGRGDTTTAVARDKGDIEAKLNMLDSMINRLDGLSSTLRVRLEPVLSPAYPREGKTDEDTREMAPLAHRLQAFYDQLDNLSDRLIDIEERIAL